MPAIPPIVDVNITLGQWPTRRVPCDDIDKLIAKLRAHNVTEAWAGHYDGLFHTDLTAINNRLAAACANVGASAGLPSSANPPPKLVPFGSINPIAPNWEAELDRCVNIHHMP